MDETTNRLIKARRAALGQAERDIRQAGANALAEGDYEDAQELMDIGTSLNTMIRQLEARMRGSADPEPAPAGKGKAKTAYPKFQRHDEELIRIGWSPSKKGEYVQRSSRSVVESIVGELAARRAKSAPVATEELIAAPELKRIPSYQIYICLGWLEQEGLVVKRGREGWQIAEGVTAPGDIDQHWKQLENVAER